MPREVRLVNIHHGKNARSHLIYGNLVDANNTQIMIVSSTIDYIFDSIRTQGYILVGDKHE